MFEKNSEFPGVNSGGFLNAAGLGNYSIEEVKALGDFTSSDTTFKYPQVGFTDSAVRADQDSASYDAEKFAGVVAPLSSLSFREAADSIFDTVDKNKNGSLSIGEIASAVSEEDFRGQQAQALVGLYSEFESLKKESDDQWFFENGISREDLEAFDDAVSQRELRRLQGNWVNDRFDQIDSNRNGYVARSELKEYLEKEPEGIISEDQVNEFVSEVDNYFNDEYFFEFKGVSKSDLYVNSMYSRYDLKDPSLVYRISDAAYRTSASQARIATRELYGDAFNPINSIVPDAIKQGKIGNCYFLASLGALARQNPQLIKDMIKDNQDGTYTVTFPGHSNKPITVSAPTDAERGLYNGGTEHGIWASVMEKAFGQYMNDEKWFFDGRTPAEGGDGGGRPEKAMRLLTGKFSEKVSTFWSSEEHLAEKLEEAFAPGSKKAVTANIYAEKKLKNRDVTRDGFYGNHAYMVEAFIRDPLQGPMVVITNPWGARSNNPSGTVLITMRELRRNFTELRISS